MDEQKYVKAVGRRLQCSKEKRVEIEQELAGDIQAALEHGESFEAVIARMGSAKSVAEEFNANLKEAGFRKRRSPAAWVMDSLGMVIVAVMVIAACVTSGIAITNHFQEKKQNEKADAGTKVSDSQKEPDEPGQNTGPAVTGDSALQPQVTELGDGDATFSKQNVEECAKQMITAFHKENFEQMFEDSTDLLKEVLGGSSDSNVLRSVKEQISMDWGAFVSYGIPYVVKVVQNGQESAVVQMNVSYEKVSVTYTITFNEQMKLDGFYVK